MTQNIEINAGNQDAFCVELHALCEAFQSIFGEARVPQDICALAIEFHNAGEINLSTTPTKEIVDKVELALENLVCG